MQRSLFIVFILLLSCCSVKRSTGINNSNSTANPPVNREKELDYERDVTVPGCLKELIRQFIKEEKQNPPRAVYGYTYMEKQVYYVPAICCDFFSDLYDSNCKLIGHPDGGYTGKGDGTAPDFMQLRKGETLRLRFATLRLFPDTQA